MKCQGGVIFVHAPRLFYYPKRRIGYARCSLTGNKNYPAITKLTNTLNGYATSSRGQPYILTIDEWIDDTQLNVSTRAAENRSRWKGIVANSSVVPRRPSKVMG